MSIGSGLDQERRHQIQIAITAWKMDAPGTDISCRDAQPTRDLALDIQIPLQFVALRWIALHVVTGPGIGREQGKDLVGKRRRRRLYHSGVQVKWNRMVDISTEQVRQRKN